MPHSHASPRPDGSDDDDILDDGSNSSDGSKWSPLVSSRWRVLCVVGLVTLALVAWSSPCIAPLNTTIQAQQHTDRWTIQRPFAQRQDESGTIDRIISGGEATATKEHARRHPATREHELVEQLGLQDMLPFATTPGDTKAEMLIIHGLGTPGSESFNYDMCSFTNVCASHDSLYLFVQDEKEHARLDALLKECFATNRHKAPPGLTSICHCFYPTFKVQLLPYFASATTASDKGITVHPLTGMKKGHYYGIHKFTSTHHIAHWAQKVVLFQSIMQHSHVFPRGPSDSRNLTIATYNPLDQSISTRPYSGAFEPLAGMVFHDMILPMTPHEASILNHSLASVLRHTPEHTGLQNWINRHKETMQFSMDLETTWKNAEAYWATKSVGAPTATPAPAPAYPRCYERLSFSKMFGLYSTNARDTAEFRSVAYAANGISRLLTTRCPPPHAVLVYRENRIILNWHEVEKLVKEMTGRPLERVTITHASTSHDQTVLFAGAGLLIGSHSSQLANVMFSHPNSAMIEVTPEFYNADFAEYAHGMGVHFQYAFGGDVPGGIVDEGNPDCVRKLATCDGDSHCVLVQRFKCGQRTNLNKNSNFNANLTAVRQAIKHSLEHLSWACGGRW